jgi:hypothetical protein
MAAVIVELAQQRTNCQLIRRLFEQKMLIMEAFAEKLLIPAVRGKNIPLIRAILETGCDINMTRVDHNSLINWRYSTALQCAIEMRDHELVSFLMDHGANAGVQNFDAIPYDTNSLL